MCPRTLSMADPPLIGQWSIGIDPWCISVLLYFCISVFLDSFVHAITGRPSLDWSMIDWHSFLMDGQLSVATVAGHFEQVQGSGSQVSGSRIEGQDKTKNQDWSMNNWHWFLMGGPPSIIMPTCPFWNKRQIVVKEEQKYTKTITVILERSLSSVHGRVEAIYCGSKSMFHCTTFLRVAKNWVKLMFHLAFW